MHPERLKDIPFEFIPVGGHGIAVGTTVSSKSERSELMTLPPVTPLDIALAIHGDKENIPISVDPAEEVREITDNEVVEILEGIDDMNEDA